MTPDGFSSGNEPSTTPFSEKPAAMTVAGLPVRCLALGTEWVMGPIPLWAKATLAVKNNAAHRDKFARILICIKLPFVFDEGWLSNVGTSCFRQYRQFISVVTRGWLKIGEFLWRGR